MQTTWEVWLWQKVAMSVVTSCMCTVSVAFTFFVWMGLISDKYFKELSVNMFMYEGENSPQT